MTRRHPEYDIQKSVVQHLRLRGVPGLVFIHPANGGSRHPAEAAKLKAMGVRAGASDLLLWHNKEAFALELKAPGGRPSSAQMEFQADMNRAGAYGCIAEGLDEAIATLEAWNLLRGTR